MALERIGQAVVLRPRGSIVGSDATNSLRAAFEDAFSECGSAGTPPMIVVDMSSVKIINAAGAGMLIANLSSAKQLSGNLKIAGLPENVEKWFGLTKLNTVFDIFKTVDEAVASFGA